MNSFETVRGEDDKEEASWVARVLLLCRCFMKRDTEGVELAFVQYAKLVTPLEAVGEALLGERLQ